MKPYLICILSLLVPSFVLAQSDWTLTTADFNTAAVAPNAVDADGVKAPTGQTPWTNIIELTNTKPANVVRGRFRLHLTNGDQIDGAPAGLEDEKLSWQSDVGQKLVLPIAAVRAIASREHVDRPIANDADDKDLALLKNNDVIRGVMTNLTATAAVVRTEAGPMDLGLDNLSLLRLTITKKTEPVKGPAWRVKLAGGSVVTATALTPRNNQLAITTLGGELQTTLGSIVSIEPLDGPVSWLSSRQPSENMHTPFLDTPWPARMNQSVAGEPIRFANRTYSHGIGVHSKSRLTWPLDGSFKTFRTQYAIDGRQSYADVDVQILLDGKPVHEAKSVKAGVLSPVVTIDLKDAKTLTLIVDYGQGYDVQDRLNWIEPALLKN